MVTYVLAGGCFWCLDAVYRRVKGVENVVSGYTGGDVPTPTYDQVSLGTTGHAEAAQVTFDENVVPADVILDLFFLIHDPTTLNRQGNDIGTQYRSAMFYADDEQKTAYEAAATRAIAHWVDPIITKIEPLGMFYPAEDYHQNYFDKNPQSGYCSTVITPKLARARSAFKKWVEEDSAR